MDFVWTKQQTHAVSIFFFWVKEKTSDGETEKDRNANTEAHNSEV